LQFRRDLIGCRVGLPHARWLPGTPIALQAVLNSEASVEISVPGDARKETVPVCDGQRTELRGTAPEPSANRARASARTGFCASSGRGQQPAIFGARQDAHIILTVDAISGLTGTPPAGRQTRRDSPTMRRLVGGFDDLKHDFDSYVADLRVWIGLERTG
jgi:hypothetical protein